ncbi:hypothetical protein ES707_15781 [subsurface metagenome]
MTVKGYFPTGFHTLPAPYVQAFLVLPRIELRGLINFMIDTGADNTTLSLIDVERMNLDYRRLRRDSQTPVDGIGGEQYFYQEEAVLIIRDENGEIYTFPIHAHIPKRGRGEQANRQRKLPSVLGRDVINQVRLSVDFHDGIVELTPPVGARVPVSMRRLI